MKKILLPIACLALLTLSCDAKTQNIQENNSVNSINSNQKKDVIINHACGRMTKVPVSRIKPDVTILFLHMNNMVSTDGIQKIPFSDLRLLDFYDNQLADLKGLREAKLNNLRVLTLSINKLTSLAELPSNLANLRALFLNHNQLTAVDWPEDIDLSNLEILMLTWNRLANLDGFKNVHFSNLKQLDLSGNPLTAETLLNVPWKNFPKLKWLYLPKIADENMKKQIEQKITKAIGNNVSIYWGGAIKVQVRSLGYPR